MKQLQFYVRFAFRFFDKRETQNLFLFFSLDTGQSVVFIAILKRHVLSGIHRKSRNERRKLAQKASQPIPTLLLWQSGRKRSPRLETIVDNLPWICPRGHYNKGEDLTCKFCHEDRPRLEEATLVGQYEYPVYSIRSSTWSLNLWFYFGVWLLIALIAAVLEANYFGAGVATVALGALGMPFTRRTAYHISKKTETRRVEFRLEAPPHDWASGPTIPGITPDPTSGTILGPIA